MQRTRLPLATLAIAALVAATTPPEAGTQVPQGAGGPASSTRFTVRVENASRSTTLKLSNGKTAAIPLSPGVWVVHTGPNPLFTSGQVEPGLGLEGLAEAGRAAAFAANFQKASGVSAAGVCKQPVATTSGPNAFEGSAPAEPKSPILDPGFHYEFTVEARPGDRLSLAMMIGESNDGLVATGADGIALFDASGRPASGDVTARLALWDAGTEVNEDPGLGPNQGMRQAAPHAGDPERRPVRPMAEAEFGDRWPAVRQLVRVTLQPARPPGTP